MRYGLKMVTCGAVISLVILGCSSQTEPPPEKTGSQTEITTESPPESTAKEEASRMVPDFPGSPTTLTLYSVDFRDEEFPDTPKNDGKERLVNYLVLGKFEIKDSAKRKSIMAAFKKAVREPAEPTKCFDPRHGLKIVDEKGVTEIVICFHCFQYISTGAHPSDRYQIISASPQEMLNSIFKEAGIAILPSMEELMKQKEEREQFERELR